ncbi:hypothetical protein [Streptomyces xiamenensis]|uniref:hypothetical protein n=1 Tax=Streptomyces xiamenensis TaxID=408015 RepID=UPI0037D94E5F
MTTVMVILAWGAVSVTTGQLAEDVFDYGETDRAERLAISLLWSLWPAVVLQLLLSGLGEI